MAAEAAIALPGQARVECLAAANAGTATTADCRSGVSTKRPARETGEGRSRSRCCSRRTGTRSTTSRSGRGSAYHRSHHSLCCCGGRHTGRHQGSLQRTRCHAGLHSRRRHLRFCFTRSQALLDFGRDLFRSLVCAERKHRNASHQSGHQGNQFFHKNPFRTKLGRRNVTHCVNFQPCTTTRNTSKTTTFG